MSDLRATLDTILRLCAESRTYTRRTQQIHEAAMLGLGMTANQRRERHLAVMDRIGDAPTKAAYLDRQERRQAKLNAKHAARAAEAAGVPP